MEGTVLRTQSSPARAWYTVAYFFSPHRPGVVWGVAVFFMPMFLERGQMGQDSPPVVHLTLREAVCVFRFCLKRTCQNGTAVWAQRGQQPGAGLMTNKSAFGDRISNATKIFMVALNKR